MKFQYYKQLFITKDFENNVLIDVFVAVYGFEACLKVFRESAWGCFGACFERCFGGLLLGVFYGLHRLPSIHVQASPEALPEAAPSMLSAGPRATSEATVQYAVTKTSILVSELV